MDATPEEAKAFWRYMTERFGTSVVDKKNAAEMTLVAHGLQLLGIQSKEDFLNRFTTTLGTVIYTPFEPGRAHANMSFWDQIVICTHEHQHVVQHRRDGLGYSINYLANTASRAQYEAEAYTCNLELHHWRTGDILDGASVASTLEYYGCTPQDILVCGKTLDLNAVTLLSGGIVTEASGAAIEWLDKHAKHLISLA